MPGLRLLFLGGTVARHDEDPSRQRIDAAVDTLSDQLAQAWRPGS
jgi:hypothetical protein